MSIKISKVYKKFKSFIALDNITIDVKTGEFLALLGPSGSGKTTLLRIIAGLEQADYGIVVVEGETAGLKPFSERRVGFVFQHYALFRHMTIFENVAFGLRIRPRETRPSNTEIEKRVKELLRLVHLEGLQGQYPYQLSGGQRQRVALARVLAVEPNVMLLDEPFGALDAKVRKEIRRLLRNLHEEMGITTIFVTHDQEEAMEIADRVAVMDRGRIVQVGTPDEIWNHPINSFVYDFLGNYNQFLAIRDPAGEIYLLDELPAPRDEKNETVCTKRQTIWEKIRQSFVSSSTRGPELSHALESEGLKLFSRPFELALSDASPSSKVSMQARVVHINPAGSLVKVDLERKSGQLIQAEVSKEVIEELGCKRGDTLWVSLKNYKIFE